MVEVYIALRRTTRIVICVQACVYRVSEDSYGTSKYFKLIKTKAFSLGGKYVML